MSEYELEPTQHLRQLTEERAVAAATKHNTLDASPEWRSQDGAWLWASKLRGRPYNIVASQITAMELTLARLDREIEMLEAQIARGSEQQDPKSASDFRDEHWWARRGLQ